MQVKDIFALIQKLIDAAPEKAASVDAVLAFEITGDNFGPGDEQGFYAVVLKENPKVYFGEEALDYVPEKGSDVTYTLSADSLKKFVHDPYKVTDAFFDGSLKVRGNYELEQKIREQLEKAAPGR